MTSQVATAIISTKIPLIFLKTPSATSAASNISRILAKRYQCNNKHNIQKIPCFSESDIFLMSNKELAKEL